LASILHVLELLLPALIPSWNFFDVIVPSPRIQYAVLNLESDRALEWKVFRPRPQRVSFLMMLQRMLWNPDRNEALFLVSCAERLIEYPTRHSEREISSRIRFELKSTSFKEIIRNKTHFKFRVVFIRRERNELKEEIAYISSNYSLNKEAINGH